MTGSSTAAPRLIAVLAVLVLSTACAARTLLPPAPQQRAAGTRPAPSSPAPALAGATAAMPGLSALLPDSPARLEAAAGLAARFAAAYSTWSWTQPPIGWLARLRPITTAQLYPAL